MDTSADVNFIRDKCESDTVTVVADGHLRDRRISPDPANYVVTLNEPIKLVYGYDILDATIPSSIFNIGVQNDTLSYWLTTGNFSPGLSKSVAMAASDPTSALYVAFADAVASSSDLLTGRVRETLLDIQLAPAADVAPGAQVGSLDLVGVSGVYASGTTTLLHGVPASAAAVGRILPNNDVTVATFDGASYSFANVSVSAALTASALLSTTAASNAREYFDNYMAGTAPPGVGVAVVGQSSVDFWGFDSTTSTVTLVPPLLETRDTSTTRGIIGPDSSSCSFGPSAYFVDSGLMSAFMPPLLTRCDSEEGIVFEIFDAKAVRLEDCATCGSAVHAHRRTCKHHRRNDARADVFVSSTSSSHIGSAVAKSPIAPPPSPLFFSSLLGNFHVGAYNDVYVWDSTTLTKSDPTGETTWTMSTLVPIRELATLEDTGAYIDEESTLSFFDVRLGGIASSKKLTFAATDVLRMAFVVASSNPTVALLLADGRVSIETLQSSTPFDFSSAASDVDVDVSTFIVYSVGGGGVIQSIDCSVSPPVLLDPIEIPLTSLTTKIACNKRTLGVLFADTNDLAILRKAVRIRHDSRQDSRHEKTDRFFSVIERVANLDISGSIISFGIDRVLQRFRLTLMPETPTTPTPTPTLTTTTPTLTLTTTTFIVDSTMKATPAADAASALCASATLPANGFVYAQNFVTRVRHAYYSTSTDFVGAWNSLDPNIVVSVDPSSSRLCFQLKPTLLSTDPLTGARRVSPATPLLARFSPAIAATAAFFIDVGTSSIRDMIGMGKTADPIVESSPRGSLTSIGTVSFSKIAYVVLRCPEIEENVFREDVAGSSGIGVFKILDVNDVLNFRFDFVNFVRRPFHPISQLTKLTLRFENTDGSLCDFNGNAAVIILGVKRYMPRPPGDFGTSYVLNPNYDPDYREYHLRTMELSQWSTTQRLELPTRDAFVREHNLHSVDPRRRLPIYEDVQDNIDDDEVDSDDAGISTQASSIWTDDDTASTTRSSIYGRRADEHDFFG